MTAKKKRKPLQGFTEIEIRAILTVVQAGENMVTVGGKPLITIGLARVIRRKVEALRLAAKVEAWEVVELPGFAKVAGDLEAWSPMVLHKGSRAECAAYVRGVRSISNVPPQIKSRKVKSKR